MVRCEAHNLETVNACVSSILTTAIWGISVEVSTSDFHSGDSSSNLGCPTKVLAFSSYNEKAVAIRQCRRNPLTPIN